VSTAAVVPTPGRPGLIAAVIGAGAVVVLIILLCLQRLWSVDYWWLWKTGQYILEHGVPRLDPFSYTNPGHQRLELRWGFCVALYWIAQTFGHSATIIAKAPIVLGMFAMSWAAAMRPRAILTGAVVVLIAAMASSQRLVVRPETISYALMAAYVLLIARRLEGPTRWVWLLPVLQVVWVNTHGLFPLGIAVVGAWLTAELIESTPALLARRGLGEDARRRLRQSAAMLGATIAASAINPYTWEAFRLPLIQLWAIHGSAQKGFIAELNSPFDYGLGFTALWYYHALAVLVVVSAAVNGFRVRPFWLILILSQYYLSATAIRNIPLFCIVAVPFVIRNLSDSRLLARPAMIRAIGFARPAVAAMLVAFCAWQARELVTDRFAVRQGDTNQFGLGFAAHRWPDVACDFLESTGEQGPIFNSLSSGSLLLARGFRVFIDPRMEVYEDGVLGEYVELTRSPERVPEFVDRYGLRVFFLEIGEELLVRHLLTAPGWRLVHADEVAAVFFRNDVAPDVPRLDMIRDTASWRRALAQSLPEPRRYEDVPWLGRVSNPAAYLRVGKLCFLAGLPADATEFYGMAFAAFPPTFTAWAELGAIARLAGDHTTAAQAFDQAVRHDPTDNASRRGAAGALLALGKLEAAASMARAASDADHEDADAAELAGLALMRLRDAQSATPYLERAAALRPEKSAVHRALGAASIMLGRVDRAEAAFERAYLLDPTDITAPLQLAMMLYGQNRTQESRVWMERGLAIAPGESRLLELQQRLGGAAGGTSP